LRVLGAAVDENMHFQLGSFRPPVTLPRKRVKPVLNIKGGPPVDVLVNFLVIRGAKKLLRALPSGDFIISGKKARHPRKLIRPFRSLPNPTLRAGPQESKSSAIEGMVSFCRFYPFLVRWREVTFISSGGAPRPSFMA
jgi:hypothetical protein